MQHPCHGAAPSAEFATVLPDLRSFIAPSGVCLGGDVAAQRGGASFFSATAPYIRNLRTREYSAQDR